MAERGQEFKVWAGILAPVLSALVLGAAGLWIQARIANDANDREYVQLALTILREPVDAAGGSRAPLRQWAVQIVDEYAPVKLNDEGRNALLQAPPAPVTSLRIQ